MCSDCEKGVDLGLVKGWLTCLNVLSQKGHFSSTFLLSTTDGPRVPPPLPELHLEHKFVYRKCGSSQLDVALGGEIQICACMGKNTTCYLNRAT